jgi:hypothetical protein
LWERVAEEPALETLFIGGWERGIEEAFRVLIRGL